MPNNRISVGGWESGRSRKLANYAQIQEHVVKKKNLSRTLGLSRVSPWGDSLCWVLADCFMEGGCLPGALRTN